MTGQLRLIIFDVDGTLVDSQGDIVTSMSRAFEQAGQAAPPREAVLSIVGLSLQVAIPRLAPGLSPLQHTQMEAWYKEAYMQLRAEQGSARSSPLYPHVRDVLTHLGGVPQNILGVATGKSRRGLDALLTGHGLEGVFVTRQVADHHPSKPHPAMIQAAMAETGIGPADTVMIGDTSFDMEMAQAAGVRAIGVGWGYHPAQDLAGMADHMVSDFRELPGVLNRVWDTKR
ncbi:HAD-IA family hydrolase [Thalassovita taeanensis]|uniref:Phosphoglycolate phosphatase n=1 Tax=Thalassovita taeanensis TaxID=657014 RepID=A0A1H9DY34_9RHOB|nr:HAD-IA family hydrolase [Thalassovita taeanensis]SEQ18410.1 phosphoglycolate phosphatase [Thalassovita taeanensis]